jgi:hypothetical protein
MSHVAPATSAQRTSPQHLQAQISHETLVQLFHQTFSSTHTPRSQDQCRTSLPRRPRNAQASNTFKLRTHTRPSFNSLIESLPARTRYLRRSEGRQRRSRDVSVTHKPAIPSSSELARDARSTLSSKVFQHAHATFEGAKGDNVARRSRDVRVTHKPATPSSADLTQDPLSTLSSNVFKHARATFAGAKGDNVSIDHQ